MKEYGISDRRLAQLQELIANGDEKNFYYWPEWRGTTDTIGVRMIVLKLDHYECQECKRHGRYRRGYIVHHKKHLRDAPELALSVYDPKTGERQLETLCKECHEAEHPEALKKNISCKEPVTKEFWD